MSIYEIPAQPSYAITPGFRDPDGHLWLNEADDARVRRITRRTGQLRYHWPAFLHAWGPVQAASPETIATALAVIGES